MRNPRRSLFPSMDNPPQGSLLPKKQPQRALALGQCYISHSGRRARLKNLRLSCKPNLNSKDPEIVAALARLREAVKDEPEPEFGFLHLLFKAQEVSEDTTATIPEVVEYMLMKWKDKSHSTAELINDPNLQP